MHWFFDSIIFLYLVAAATFGVAIFRDRKVPGKWEHRHPRTTLTVFLLLCLSAVMMLWGSFIEPRLITVRNVSIDLPNFEPTQPVHAALISDVHVGTYKKEDWLRRVSERIIKEKPDLVLIAGDLIVNKPEHAKYLAGFRLLTSIIPTYAVLGDHDYHVKRQPFSIDEATAQAVADTLTGAGIEVLRNETRIIETNGASFILVGLDDWLAGKTVAPPLGGESSPPSGGAIVVLIHNPDFILSEESKNADLILAGNTHGGQIRLPLVGPVARLPSQLPRTFDEGLFDLQYTEALPPELRRQGLLFITSGISESGPRARLFNPPEIVILELY